MGPDGGFELLPESQGEGHFVVVRDPRFDVEVGPLGPLVPNGEVLLEGIFPVPTEELFEPPALVAARLTPKRSGRAKFVFVAGGMVPPRLAEVHVLGDFNAFSATQGMLELFDDGSLLPQEDDQGNEFVSGDAVANDGVFVRVVEGLPPGRLRYRLLLNRGIEWFRDPLEEDGEMTDFGYVSVVEIP